MNRTVRVLSLVAVTVAVVAPLHAHHSFGAEYDVNQPVTVSGVVTKIEWTNPHSFVYVDVAEGGGNVTNWKFEGYPPNALYRTGWKRDVTMKVGDKVTISGWRARLGGNLAHSREITLPDGNKLFFGPPAGTGDGGNTPPVKVP